MTSLRAGPNKLSVSSTKRILSALYMPLLNALVTMYQSRRDVRALLPSEFVSFHCLNKGRSLRHVVLEATTPTEELVPIPL